MSNYSRLLVIIASLARVHSIIDIRIINTSTVINFALSPKVDLRLLLDPDHFPVEPIDGVYRIISDREEQKIVMMPIFYDLQTDCISCSESIDEICEYSVLVIKDCCNAVSTEEEAYCGGLNESELYSRRSTADNYVFHYRFDNLPRDQSAFLFRFFVVKPLEGGGQCPIDDPEGMTKKCSLPMGTFGCVHAHIDCHEDFQCTQVAGKIRCVTKDDNLFSPPKSPTEYGQVIPTPAGSPYSQGIKSKSLQAASSRINTYLLHENISESVSLDPTNEVRLVLNQTPTSASHGVFSFHPESMDYDVVMVPRAILLDSCISISQPDRGNDVQGNDNFCRLIDRKRLRARRKTGKAFNLNYHFVAGQMLSPVVLFRFFAGIFLKGSPVCPPNEYNFAKVCSLSIDEFVCVHEGIACEKECSNGFVLPSKEDLRDDCTSGLDTDNSSLPTSAIIEDLISSGSLSSDGSDRRLKESLTLNDLDAIWSSLVKRPNSQELLATSSVPRDLAPPEVKMTDLAESNTTETSGLKKSQKKNNNSQSGMRKRVYKKGPPKGKNLSQLLPTESLSSDRFETGSIQVRYSGISSEPTEADLVTTPSLSSTRKTSSKPIIQYSNPSGRGGILNESPAQENGASVENYPRSRWWMWWILLLMFTLS